nr:hypothetical protein [Acetobacter persici]
MNEGASLVTQSAGHGPEGGIAPDSIGHGQGGGIEQKSGDLALAGPGLTEIVGVKAEQEPAMAGLGDASGMACRKREAQRHRGKTHGFVGTASEQRIKGNMQRRADDGGGAAVQGEGECCFLSGQDDDMAHCVGFFEDHLSKCGKFGQGGRRERIECRCQRDDAAGGAWFPYDGNTGDGDIGVMRENAASIVRRNGSTVSQPALCCLP